MGVIDNDFVKNKMAQQAKEAEREKKKDLLTIKFDSKLEANKKLGEFVEKCLNIKENKLDDCEVVRGILSEYFNMCFTNDIPVALNDIALCLGISTKKFLGIVNSTEHKDIPDGTYELLTKARQVIEAYHERGLKSATSIGSMFALKAQYKWRDGSEKDNRLSVNLNFGELRKEYTEKILEAEIVNKKLPENNK